MASRRRQGGAASSESETGSYQDDDEDEEGAGSSSSSGSSDDELHESSEEELARMRCGICKQPLVPRHRRPGSRGAGRQGEHQALPHLRICDGCHTPFHAACCRRKGRGMRSRDQLAGDAWYCSPRCKEQHTGLLLQCARGDCPTVTPTGHSSTGLGPGKALTVATHASSSPGAAPSAAPDGPASWQLAQGGARQGSIQWQGVLDALRVLSTEYGPFVMGQVEASDYVAVLRRGGVPVTALTMDCFGGQQGCVVDLGSTQPDARMQGNMRALLSSVEHCLASSAATERLLAVVSEPSSAQGRTAQQVWQRHLGYSKLTNRQVHKLQEEVPVLSLHGSTITVFSKKLQAAAPSGTTTSQPTRQALGSPASSLAGDGAQAAGSPAGSGVPGNIASQTGGAGAGHDDDGRSARPRHRRSYWRFRLWGWMLRKTLSAATFGMLG